MHTFDSIRNAVPLACWNCEKLNARLADIETRIHYCEDWGKARALGAFSLHAAQRETALSYLNSIDYHIQEAIIRPALEELEHLGSICSGEVCGLDFEALPPTGE